MQLTHAVLHRLHLPLVSPFRTSNGTETARDVLLVQIVGPDIEGWGECVAEAAPTYTAEFVDGAQAVISRFLLPRLDAAAADSSSIARRFAAIKGNPMAKAGIEAAVLDAECRRDGVSLAARLGGVRDRIASGVAVGIHDSVGALLDSVDAYVAQGYLRVKLKIERGNDIDQVAAVRDRYPNLALQVDGNGAYSLADAEHLARLDAFDLQLIEQPFADDDIRSHATLARQINTPICLDESITSVRSAQAALSIGACSVVNIKPGRVGGFLTAVAIHDICVASNVAVWCGGMLETGVGRAANLALASLPGFTLPGDTSASDRYFHRDVTDAFVLDDGHLRVPTGPGIGVEPLADRLAEFTVSTETIDLRA